MALATMAVKVVTRNTIENSDGSTTMVVNCQPMPATGGTVIAGPGAISFSISNPTDDDRAKTVRGAQIAVTIDAAASATTGPSAPAS